MDTIYTAEEIRVLATLIEKEMATPEYYPLTLNSLLNACNQKTNREPVVNYTEEIVLGALDALKKKRAVWQSNLGRSVKYEEGFLKECDYDSREAAVICILMLRGPQTAGEIKARTDRLHHFESLEEVNATLEGLCTLGHAARLARQPGRKEARYNHLFSGEEESVPSSSDKSSEEVEKVTALEEKVAALSLELEELKEQFSQFQKQFE